MSTARRAICSLLLCVLAACSRGSKVHGCAPGDMDCLNNVAVDHPARFLRTWRTDLARPLDQRIGPAPQVLVDYLQLDNLRNGFADQPQIAVADEAFQADVQAALAELPMSVRQGIENRLIGIYLVDHLGGSGFSDKVLDISGKSVAGFVVLDQGRLASLSANAWASWKENSAFKPVPGFALSAEIETAQNDNRRNAIQYILLHELGHIQAIGEYFHPDWTRPPAEITGLDQYPYFGLSWQRSADKRTFVSRFDDTFRQRNRVAYYFRPQLGADEMVATYTGLLTTNFPTLYATTNPTDDFAEAYVNYVHTVLMGRPFAVRIRAQGREVLSYKGCWDEPRCASKRAILEQLLRQPGAPLSKVRP